MTESAEKAVSANLGHNQNRAPYTGCRGSPIMWAVSPGEPVEGSVSGAGRCWRTRTGIWLAHIPVTLGEVQKRHKGLPCRQEEGLQVWVGRVALQVRRKDQSTGRLLPCSRLHWSSLSRHLRRPAPHTALFVPVPHLPPWLPSRPRGQPRDLSVLSQAWEPWPKRVGKHLPLETQRPGNSH